MYIIIYTFDDVCVILYNNNIINVIITIFLTLIKDNEWYEYNRIIVILCNGGKHNVKKMVIVSMSWQLLAT